MIEGTVHIHSGKDSSMVCTGSSVNAGLPRYPKIEHSMKSSINLWHKGESTTPPHLFKSSRSATSRLGKIHLIMVTAFFVKAKILFGFLSVSRH